MSSYLCCVLSTAASMTSTPKTTREVRSKRKKDQGRNRRTRREGVKTQRREKDKRKKEKKETKRVSPALANISIHTCTSCGRGLDHPTATICAKHLDAATHRMSHNRLRFSLSRTVLGQTEPVESKNFTGAPTIQFVHAVQRESVDVYRTAERVHAAMGRPVRRATDVRPSEPWSCSVPRYDGI